jgi:transcriptional regulator with XRE-family HTH domain
VATATELSGGGAGRQEFAARLKRLRQEAGLSQIQLAGEDLSPSYVSLLEAGKRRPSPEVVLRLAERLGCSPSLLGDGRASERERRIELELAYARLALTHGEAASARDQLIRLLAEEGLDQRSTDEALLMLANAHEKLGAYGDAIGVLRAVHRRCVEGNSHLTAVTVALPLSLCYMQAGDVHHALAVGQEALARAATQGMAGSEDYFRLAAILLWAHHEIGNLAHAMAWAEELIEEAELHGSARSQASLYWNAALVADSLGSVDRALRLSQAALARLAEGSDTRDLSRLRIAIGMLLLGTSPPRAPEALQTLTLAEPHLRDLGGAQDRMRWERTTAVARLLLGDLEPARRHAATALEHVGDTEHEDRATCLMVLGDVDAADGLVEQALASYRAASKALRQAPANRATARAWRDLGDRFVARGLLSESTTCFRQALDTVGLHDRSVEIRATAREAPLPALPESARS